MPLGLNTSSDPIPGGLKPQEFAALFKLSPAEAVAYMTRRSRVTATFSWRELWQEEHAHQFTVSRLSRLDLLEDFQRLIQQSVDGDLSRRDWTRNARAALEGAGWWGTREVIDPRTGEVLKTTFDSRRLKLIFDINTRVAYAAGQWERAWRNKRTHPYLRYLTLGDERVRASHRPWDGVTLPIDDPWWDTHYPPNGWGCRCRVISMSQRDYDKALTNGFARRTRDRVIDEQGRVRFGPARTERIPIQTTAPPDQFIDWTNKTTGEVSRIPTGIDPGWGYNVGKASMRTRGLDTLIEEKLARAPPKLAEAAKAAGLWEDVIVPHKLSREAFAAEMRSLPSGGGADPDQLYDLTQGRLSPLGLARALTGGPIDEVNFSISGDRFYVYAWGGQVHGGDIISMTRYFRPATGEVHHDVLQFAKESQGSGATKAYFRAVIPEYQRMGMKFITLMANIDVGSYAWARYGFLPDNPALFAGIVERRLAEIRAEILTRGITLSPAAQRELDGFAQFLLAHRDDRTFAWGVVDRATPHLDREIDEVFEDLIPKVRPTANGKNRPTFAKALTFNEVWNGRLDLSDPEAMQRLANYVQGTKK